MIAQEFLANNIDEPFFEEQDLPEMPDVMLVRSLSSRVSKCESVKLQLIDFIPKAPAEEGDFPSMDFGGSNNYGMFMDSMDWLGQDDKKVEAETGAGFVDTTSSKLVAPSQKEQQVQEGVLQVEPTVLEDKNENQLNEFENIFTEKKIKGGFKKNTNVPKFIVRIFMKHFTSFARKYSSDALLKHHKKVKKQLTSRTSNNYTISDVLALFRDTSNLSEQNSMLNQRIMAQIIGQTLNDQVIENKYIKDNRISYMLAMKIYAYRCRSKTLSERVKIF